MTRNSKLLFISVFTILLGFLIFVLWDNDRIKVVQQDIIIDHLPDELDGFQILQITDLHEREFGTNQTRLLQIINSLDYDIIVFTGDMLDHRESTNFQPFYAVLEGIEHKENMLVVSGNADPPSYQFKPKFGKSEYVKGIEKREATFLESITTIEKNGKRVHFVNFELSIIQDTNQIGMVNGSFQEPNASNEQYNRYQKKLWEEMIHGDAIRSEDMVIALNHFPIPDMRIDYIESDPTTTWPNIDLIIAGHYHGGQIRLPFFGALFIPEPWYEPHSFFPPTNRVKGLWEYKGTKQFVSAGLGTSDAIPFLKFRLFNPPEVNVLTLRKP